MKRSARKPVRKQPKAPRAAARTKDRTTIKLNGLKVTLSEPVLVKRGRSYCWFPSLIRLPNGHVWAAMSAYADIHVSTSTLYLSRSRDSGLTWEEPKIVTDGGLAHVVLADGSALLLPYYMRPRPGGMGAPANLILPSGEVRYVSTGIQVTGWPRPDKPFAPELGTSGFVTNGQTVEQRDGAGYLGTLYGTFEGDSRYSLVLAESADGYAWRIRSVIAGSDCALEGQEGPCEAALCRLADHRLMCVFRNASFVPYGQTWSDDDGKTWSKPIAMPAQSVEPSLQVLPNGVAALAGGRSGIFVWLNADGRGTDWQAVDIVAHHNACRPRKDRINPDSTKAWVSAEEMIRTGTTGFSSCYVELAALDDRHLLLIYDRLGLGWHPLPDNSDETNSVWVVKIAVTR